MLIEAPQGYSFEVLPLTGRCLARINLLYLDEVKQRPGSGEAGSYGQVGRIILERSDWNDSLTFEEVSKLRQLQTHSYLGEKHRGKGLGALMYAYAINYALERGYSIRCSYNRSDCARNVWAGKTIRQFFRIKSRTITYSGTPRLIYHAYAR